MKSRHITFATILYLSISPLLANTVRTTVYSTQNPHHSIGQITFKDTQQGLLITPDLSELSPGDHGFHVHIQPSCAQQGKGAGGHLDPLNTQKHLGPKNIHGHLGDLPVLHVDKQGKTNQAVVAPRLTTQNLHRHSIMIHQNGDNYQDKPQPLGGGGARVACGIIQ